MRTFFVAATIAAAALAAAGLAALRMDRGGARSEPAGRPELEARLERLAAEVEARLARLEDRLPGAWGAPPAPGEPFPEEAGEAEGGAPTPREELAARLARLEARLQVLEARLKGLEEDPVERGFTYASSTSPELRRRGVKALERVARSDPQALEAIRRLLADPEPRVRQEAVESIADLADGLSPGDPRLEEAARSLAERLSDEDPRVRRAAADLLGDLRSPQAALALIASLEDPDREVRRRVIDSLADLEDPAAVPALRALHERGERSLELALALKRLGDPVPFRSEAERLAQTFSTSQDEGERRKALKVLARQGGEEFRALFTRALSDPSPAVRKEAGEALEALEKASR
jgi:HEAT repeat protein